MGTTHQFIHLSNVKCPRILRVANGEARVLRVCVCVWLWLSFSEEMCNILNISFVVVVEVVKTMRVNCVSVVVNAFFILNGNAAVFVVSTL